MTTVDQLELRGAPERAPKYNLRTLNDLEAEGNIVGKVIFLRGDIDVLSDNQSSDPSASIRLRNVTDTVRQLLDMGASKVVIGGHIDRPKAQEEELSTKHILGHLQVLLGEEVTHISFE
ncbi:MAG: phosphoglycerate kinase, partial [Candidatus Curtissbacteria bacterium]